MFFLLIFQGCKKNPADPPVPSFELLGIIQSPKKVYLNQTVTFEAQIYAPNQDTLRYLWRSSQGYFDNPESNPVSWHAPDSATSVTISLTIFDSQDLSVDTTFVLAVGNQPPVFKGFIYPTKNVIIGNEINIRCQYVDADSEAVHVAWYSSGGVFTLVTNDSVRWQAPTQPGTYQIWAELTDSSSTVISDTLNLIAYREYGCVWVIEKGSKSVKKFTDDGILLFEIGGFANPAAVKVNPRDKSCWVADATYNGQGGKIYRISFNGDTIKTLGNFIDPQDVDVYILEKDVWVVDSKQNTLVCISPITFSIKKTITGFYHPLALDIDQPSREVWVADTDNDRIVKISFDVPDNYNVDSDSGYHEIIQIADPVDISADQNDDAVWVAQRFQNKVTYIRTGFNPYVIADLVQPMCVQAGIYSGECWISDTGQNRILKFSGGQIVQTVSDGFLLPTKITLNIFDGSFWVLDSQNNRLVKVDNNGNIIKAILGLNEPWDLSVNFGQ